MNKKQIKELNNTIKTFIGMWHQDTSNLDIANRSAFMLLNLGAIKVCVAVAYFLDEYIYDDIKKQLEDIVIEIERTKMLSDQGLGNGFPKH